MRNVALVFTGIVAIGAGGCGDNDHDDDLTDGTDGTDDTGGDTTPPPTPPTPPTPRTWRADIRGNDLYSTLVGTSVVTAFDGNQGFTATIQVRGDEPGSVRPWHVHVGACGTAGAAIVGPDDAYPRLMVGASGGGEAATNVLVALDSGAYHVNIHHSDALFSTLIACGNLIRQ